MLNVLKWCLLMILSNTVRKQAGAAKLRNSKQAAGAKRNWPPDNELFNRAWLANVGLSEVNIAQPSTWCVVFHDVDLIPELGV